MNRSSRQTVTQACPNCGKVHDTSVYVSGQTIACDCGIRFEVRRTDVRPSGIVDRTVLARQQQASPAEAPVPSSVEIVLESDPGTTRVQDPAPQLPGYELLEVLGRGGMGEVWRARQVSLNRQVAVKILPPKFSADREFVARFEKEATALAALNHPNVVQIIDRGQVGSSYFFVMELVAGVNLRELLTRRRMSVKDALRIVVQLAKAIDYAHEQKVVHRDLKPENVLVDPRGNVKIADFGLAGMQGSDRNIALTATAVAMGTVNYMAPEQRRDAKHVDHRADLYSLGVLLYELLTGELPLGRFKMPSVKVPGLALAIDEIVGRLLETEPEQRPDRALDVAAVLEPLIESAGSVAPELTRKNTTVSGRLSSVVQEPGGGWKVAVFVLGALLVVALGARFLPMADAPPSLPTRAPAWYQDTDESFYSGRREEKGSLYVGFDPSTADGGEAISAHAGHWALDDGALTAIQFGDVTDPESLELTVVPRAYLGDRYYSTDGFNAEVDVSVEPLSPEFPPLAVDAQRFVELSFRIKDTQVSLFAIPDVPGLPSVNEMRLMWRYFLANGSEEVGNSSADPLIQDRIPVPRGKFHMALSTRVLASGSVEVRAMLNEKEVLRKELPGLGYRTGKVALGCRNLQCRFEALSVKGRAMSKPAQKKPE